MGILNYAYVALFDGTPIAVAHTREDIEFMLDDYNGVANGHSVRVNYEPYNSKYPSINDLEGMYTYQDLKTGGVDFFKVYGVEYEREKQ